ncbi:MAG: hypothetical protein NDJ89_09550 [Oligoflexia bacterium]|nr:hypothetical protein [Oligoflexia bacterium]
MGLFSDPLNALSFTLRDRFWGRLRLRRKSPVPRVDETIRREREFYSLLLTRAFPLPFTPKPGLWVDVGCRNWSYAPALAQFFPGAALLGVELDGRRRYWNLHRRMDLAQAFARECRLPGTGGGAGAECFFGDFRKLSSLPRLPEGNAPVLFSFFYPFVSPDPCHGWGLPAKFADWAALLKHGRALARTASRPALFLSVHQGEWEAEIARTTLARLKMPSRELRVHAKEFQGLWPSPHDAYLFTAAFPAQSKLPPGASA